MKKKPKSLRSVNLLTIIVLIFSIFWLMPLILIFINSFKPYNDIIQHFLALPKSWSLDMYIETWTKFRFPTLLSNTLLYTVCTVIVIALLAPMAAYKLARTKSRFSSICFGLLLMPIMVPFTSYMITLVKLVANVNLSGTKIGYIVVSIGLCFPLSIYMVHGFVKSVPIELEECARIDGAGPIRIYFNIVFPLLKPILTTVIVLDSFSTWNDVIVNQMIVGMNANAMNIQNALFTRFSANSADWEHALPGIVMAIIPSLIFFIVMQKYIVGDVTAGAVKG